MIEQIMVGFGKSPKKAIIGLLIAAISMTPVISSSISEAVYAANPTSPAVNSITAGANDPTTDPASATIAASPTEQIELVNSRYMILRGGKTAATGTSADLVGKSGTFLSDPQIMWDASTGRFFYSLFENIGTTSPNEGIAWGFSKNATPSGPSDFCSYFNGFNYGATSFPDRQSLGDSGNFILIGSNRYSTSNESIMGSDLAWITKPAAGTSCPPASSFTSGVKSLTNPDGTPAYTPTPAKQVGATATGYVAATPNYVSGKTLSLFSVTKSPTSNSAVISKASSVPVPAFSNPPSAPQAGKTIYTGLPASPLETRIYLSQAIMALDPRLGHYVIWTAHTIAGGAGSEVRWYEINPANLSLDQVGTVSDPNLYVFNATISPDRVVTTSTKAFGDSAIVNVSTSSINTFPAIQMVSTVSGKPQSKLVMVKQSSGTNLDFTCFTPRTMTCRWGDYSGIVPDPNSPISATHGNMWLSNQWNTPNIDDSTPVWQTSIVNVHP